MSLSIEIFPKQRFDHTTSNVPFDQSTAQAIDTAGYNFVSIEAWAWNLQTGDKVQVDLFEATVNEDDAFVKGINTPAATTLVTLNGSGGTLQTSVKHVSAFSRFLRIEVTPTLTSGNIVDLRVRLNLKKFL